MKKTISISVALLMLFSIFGISAFAESNPKTANVYVTISNAGNLVVCQEKITVTDRNNDGNLDIDEALYATHEAKYEGGAAAGYSSANTPQYGLSLTKLWGVENGGSYGYYVENESAWSLADIVEEGNYITAFVYKDIACSDKYSFFNKNTLTATAETEIALTLSTFAYDSNWQAYKVPVKNATITLNGEATEYKTDENGEVTMKISKAGDYIVSATSATEILVPPVLTLTVNANPPVTSTPQTGTPETIATETNKIDNKAEEDKSPKTGVNSNLVLYAVILSMYAMCIVVGTFVLKKKANEK